MGVTDKSADKACKTACTEKKTNTIESAPAIRLSSESAPAANPVSESGAETCTEPSAETYAEPSLEPGLGAKLRKLEAILSGYGRMTVALSGGVDSVFLLSFAYRLWHDDRITALTAAGPHFAPDETEYSIAFCRKLGIAHELIPVDHILPIIADNPPDRCYICKRAIFTSIKQAADAQERVLADGTNLDDMSDYRPGHRALQELGVASPLKEAGLTKREIRRALQLLAGSDPLITDALTVPTPGGSIPMWEKPAFACLASRIPYGERITAEKLTAVYKAESYLRGLGFTQLRVRHHGDVARIEVLPEELVRFYDKDFMETVNEEIKKCGFRFAALDLGGYRMGSLNSGQTEEPGTD